MKHIAILIACVMLSACKEKPEVQTWEMAPESEWSAATNSFNRLNLGGKVSDSLTITEIVRRSALAGLAMGLNRGNEGYEALSNELWAIYTGKTNYTVKTNSP